LRAKPAVKSRAGWDDGQGEVFRMESQQSPSSAVPVDPAAKAASPAPVAETEQREQGPDRRQSVVERRTVERRMKSRDESGYTGPERRVAERRDDTGLERRRGPGRRRSDDRRSAEEGEMTAEQFEFVQAIETYKRVNKKMFPTWTEVLEVINQLGYRKVEHRSVELPNVPEPQVLRKSA